MQLIHVGIGRDNLPKYGMAATKSFLGTALTTSFGASILSKNSFNVIVNQIMRVAVLMQNTFQLINLMMKFDKIRVYKFQCGGCNATYYAKTRRYFKVGMYEDLGIYALTGKRIKSDDDSAIKKHLLFCNQAHDFDDFSIFATKNNNFKVTLMESVLINRDRPHFE